MRALGALSVLATAAHGQVSDAVAAAREAEATSVTVGCCVLERGSGAVLFERRADQLFIPASNQKVLTAVAAIEGLGPDYRFRTVFRLRGGRLEIVAGGDPNWRTGSAHDPAEIFEQVGRALLERGISAVQGIHLDLGAFRGPTRPSGWPQDQLDNYYCAPTAGLVLDEGCFRARITAQGGSAARIQVLAPFAMPVEGSLSLTSDKRRGSVYGLRDGGGHLIARGRFYRKSGAREVTGALQDPIAIYREAAARGLQAAGVEISPGARPADTDLWVYESDLADALHPMMVDSSNFHAEQVLRVLGAETQGLGTFPGGIVAVRAVLTRALPSVPEGWLVADGSGLSRDNRLSPRLLAESLRLALSGEHRDVLLAAMPQPGEGSLSKRFRNSQVADSVWAKSGWIRGASTLSGCVGDVVFAITMNYDPDRGGLNKKLKALQERMVEAFAGMRGA